MDSTEFIWALAQGRIAKEGAWLKPTLRSLVPVKERRELRMTGLLNGARGGTHAEAYATKRVSSWRSGGRRSRVSSWAGQADWRCPRAGGGRFRGRERRRPGLWVDRGRRTGRGSGW